MHLHSVLTNILFYMISFFYLSKGASQILDYFRTIFFWHWDIEKNKYLLARWNVVCRTEDHWGLGVRDLEVKNTALLKKWLFKLLTKDKVWQTVLNMKYISWKALSLLYWKPGDPHFWDDLMMTNKHFFRFGSFSIKDGSEIRSLEHKWLGNTTLWEKYLALYNIVRHKCDTISIVLEKYPPNVTFRWDLVIPGLATL